MRERLWGIGRMRYTRFGCVVRAHVCTDTAIVYRVYGVNLQGRMRSRWRLLSFPRPGMHTFTTATSLPRAPHEQTPQALSLPRQLGVVLLAGVFVLYPGLVSASLSVFACRILDTPGAEYGGVYDSNLAVSEPSAAMKAAVGRGGG